MTITHELFLFFSSALFPLLVRPFMFLFTLWEVMPHVLMALSVLAALWAGFWLLVLLAVVFYRLRSFSRSSYRRR